MSEKLHKQIKIEGLPAFRNRQHAIDTATAILEAAQHEVDYVEGGMMFYNLLEEL